MSDGNQVVIDRFKEFDNVSMCMTISSVMQLNKIIAPGIYNLIGDRYILLKCPEIEDHLFKTRSYEKYSIGLAKFKLAVLGYDDVRFDYSSLTPNKFHPIGKMTQLTFRFLRPDGTLYNFRGINHTITLAVKYYVPLQKEKFSESSLNPNYNPDFFQYIKDSVSSEEDSDSES